MNILFQVDYKRLSEDLSKIVDMRGTNSSSSGANFIINVHVGRFQVLYKKRTNTALDMRGSFIHVSR